MGALDSLKSRLRRFKPFWAFYNLAHYRDLRRNAALYREFGVRGSVLGPIAHREISRPAAGVPWLDSPDAERALEAHPEVSTFPDSIRGHFGRWIDDGYLVLERYFEPALMDEINGELDRLLAQGDVSYHFRDERVVNAFRASAAISKAVRDPELLRLLSFLLGREVALFQTINFEEGSEQQPHSDSFHMTTEPLGYLTAIWVALEDVTPDSGPVYYYPGSHRLPYIMSEDLAGEESRLFLDGDKDRLYEARVAKLIADIDIEPVDFLPGKGDVLVWHANLLHGGRPIATPGLTRKSLVAHYFAKGVLCYHEVTERPAIVAG